MALHLPLYKNHLNKDAPSLFGNLRVVIGITNSSDRKRKKENANVLLGILTRILENELKCHSKTVEDLYLVQATHTHTHAGKGKRNKKDL